MVNHPVEARISRNSYTDNSGQSNSAIFWRDRLLGHLIKMLSAGDYAPLQISRHVEFFSEWIAPLLGPQPLLMPNGHSTPAFNSYMCDDHTPIEFSLSWKPNNGKPMVRFSIEPLPTGEETYCSDTVSYGLHVIESLQEVFRSPGAPLSDYLVLYPSLFLDVLKSICFSNATTNVSNIFLGFDLHPCLVQVKAYVVLNCSLDPTEKLSLMSGALSASKQDTTASTLLLKYFRSKTTNWHSKYRPDPFLIGIDCTGTDDARVKVYFRYQVTDFDNLVDQLSLGLRIPLSLAYIKSLHDLWCRLTRLSSNPFLRTSHTSGILVYYEFCATKSLPNVKVYLPVRLMAKNDQAIADAATEWLHEHPIFSQQSDSFLNTVVDTWDDRDLTRTVGTFTYIGLSFAAGAVGCHPSIYFNPAVFSVPASVQGLGPCSSRVSLRKPLARLTLEAGIISRELPNNCQLVAQTWFEAFSKHVSDPGSHFGTVLTPNSFWRDLVAFSQDIRTFHGRPSIQAFLKERSSYTGPTNFELTSTVKGRTLANSLNVIQGVFLLQTFVGHCSGIFTLVPTVSGEWKALTIVVGLERLHTSVNKFSEGITIDPSVMRPAAIMNIPSQNPTVIVIGAGQAGLAVAARLEHLGISTLIIERRARVGDSWRTRYESLKINTPKNFSHLPFVPFPDEWPTFPTSEVVADHLEAYPRTLGLRVLTSTTVEDTHYDNSSGVWTLRVRIGSGAIIPVQTRHLVVATGVDTLAGSQPKIPSIPKVGYFTGKIMHSTEFKNGEPWSGKKTIVIGAGCSGHDIAQELHRRGAATVTIVQRSSTAVVSRRMLLTLFPDLYTGDNQPPTPIADRLFLSFPTAVTRSLQHEIMKTKETIDRDLVRDLRQKGFLLPDEDDNFFERLMIRRGGYYIDQGCSSLIINEEINLKAGIPITEYTPLGLLFADGTELQADLVVYATGYRNESLVESSSRLLNYSLLDKVKSLGGWDAEYEMAGLWRPTGHRGLWFAGGDLFTCRFYSRLLAMQIKAEEECIF